MKNVIIITFFLMSSLSFETDWFDYFKADYFVSATTGNDSNDGTAIPNVIDGTTWAGLTTGARCSYDNDETNAINP